MGMGTGMGLNGLQETCACLLKILAIRIPYRLSESLIAIMLSDQLLFNVFLNVNLS